MSQLPQIKKRGTLTQHTYETLKTAIIESTLPPGQLLLEESLSEQLGVSRTPIRAAINQLIHEGLVDVLAGHGTFVSQLQESQFRDLFAVRKILERLAMDLCIQGATEENMQTLYQVVLQERTACQQPGFHKLDFLKTDIDFHMQLANASNNVYLERQLEQVLSNSCRYVFAYTSDHVLPVVTQEHEMIYQFILERDAQQAQACLSAHLADVESRVISDLRHAKHSR